MPTFQQIAFSVRPVIFSTGWEGFPFSTHGGTLFLIEYGGRVYALTCAHVLHGFSADDLIVPQDQIPPHGSPAAACKGLYLATDVGGSAVGSDPPDICVLDFRDDVPEGFFNSAPFPISDGTTRSSVDGHELQVFGILKGRTEIDPEIINIGFCALDFTDRGEFRTDAVLRMAEGEWENRSIESITGISGAPVFDKTSGKLCGMVARGTVKDGMAIIYFIDIFHILAFLTSSVGGVGAIQYEKPAAR